jgi:hypothetical protein
MAFHDKKQQQQQQQRQTQNPRTAAVSGDVLAAAVAADCRRP